MLGLNLSNWMLDPLLLNFIFHIDVINFAKITYDLKWGLKKKSCFKPCSLIFFLIVLSIIQSISKILIPNLI